MLILRRQQCTDDQQKRDNNSELRKYSKQPTQAVGCMTPSMDALEGSQRFMRKSDEGELKRIRKNAGARSENYQNNTPLGREKNEREHYAKERIRADCDDIGEKRAIIFHWPGDLGVHRSRSDRIITVWDCIEQKMARESNADPQQRMRRY